MPQMEDSLLDIVVASTRQAVVMVEAGASEGSEDLVFEALKFGHEANQEIIGLQEEIQQEWGKPKVAVEAREIARQARTAVLGKQEEVQPQPSAL